MSEVPIVPRMFPKAIEQKANTLLRKYPDAYSGSCPVPVDLIFENDLEDVLGVRVIYTDIKSLLGFNVLGYTNSTEKVSAIHSTVANNPTEAGRRFFRSTVGHEIGHCCLHVPLERWRTSLQVAGIGLYRTSQNIAPVDDPEWQAWCFCQALCMPARLVNKMVAKYGVGQSGVDALVDAFDMSYSFVNSRLRSLKLMPRNSGNYHGAKICQEFQSDRGPDRALTKH